MFDKSEITRVCERFLGSGGSLDDDGEYERTELEGRTCFAQLTLDRTGELVLEPAKAGPVSRVSTLPWALGQLEKGGLASLSSNEFEIAKQGLAGVLLNFQATRKGALTGADILELHRALEEWAGFSTADTGLIGFGCR